MVEGFESSSIFSLPNFVKISCCSSRLEKRILGFKPLMFKLSQGARSVLGLSRGSTSTSRFTWNKSGYFSWMSQASRSYLQQFYTVRKAPFVFIWNESLNHPETVLFNQAAPQCPQAFPFYFSCACQAHLPIDCAVRYYLFICLVLSNTSVV